MRFSQCFSCMKPTDRFPCPHCGFDGAPQAAHGLSYGTILNGRYLVGRMLGQGGFGITYACWDLKQQVKVAVKEYYPKGQVTRQTGTTLLTWGNDPESNRMRVEGMQAFIREAVKMERVRGLPGVVQVREVFQENSTAYIVMDFAEGVTLKQLVQSRGPLPWDQCRTLFLSAISVMDRVHSAGIIHRDLSPDNLMIAPDGQVLILDLGAAKELSSQNAESSVLVAKRGYSPLEQYSQRGATGPHSDVYAMAATIFFTLTGTQPVPSMDRVERETMNWNHPGLKTAPPQVLSALQKAMSVMVQSRIQTMGDFSRALTAKKKAFPLWILPTAGAVAAAAILALILLPRLLKPAGPTQPTQETVTLPTTTQATPPPESSSAPETSVEPTEKETIPSETAPPVTEAPAPARPNTVRAYHEAEDLPDFMWAREDAVYAVDGGSNHTVALYMNGTVKAVGENYCGQCDVEDWTDVIQISTLMDVTLGLRVDGRVYATGDNQYGACNVDDWEDIVFVSAGRYHSVGVRSDGTVVAVGGNAGGQCNVEDWRDIEKVYATSANTLGLKSDGTVIITGSFSGGKTMYLQGWTNIKDISLSRTHFVGLTRDGRVVAAAGSDKGQNQVSEWRDVRSIAAGEGFTVAVRSDGNVLFAGDGGEFGLDGVDDWGGIWAIACGGQHIIGITNQGRLWSCADKDAACWNIDSLNPLFN